MSPLTDPTDVAGRVLALVGGRAEAQVTARSGRSALTRFANSFIHQNVATDATSVSLKLALPGAGGARVASASTSRTDPEGLTALVETALAAAGLRPVDPRWPGLADPAVVAGTDDDHYDLSTVSASPAERAERVAAFVDADRGLLAAGYCDTEGGVTAFANSAGQHARAGSSRATLDGIHRSPTSAGSAHATSACFADLDAAAAGRAAAGRARRSENPVDVEPGEWEVVLEPECVAALVEFLAVYGFNAKGVIEESSGIEVGEDQFDPSISIWDDATDASAVGVPFDVDGTPKRRVDLVRSGRTVSLVHDRRTAARMGAASTGHAIPGADAWGPVPSNVFVGAGADGEVVDLVAGVRHGLLVTTFNYCRVLDPKTLVVTGLTRNGTFLITNGEVGAGVANLRFTQSFLTALAPGNVAGVGSQARFADSEFGGGGAICVPPLRLSSFRFTGGARG